MKTDYRNRQITLFRFDEISYWKILWKKCIREQEELVILQEFPSHFISRLLRYKYILRQLTWYFRHAKIQKEHVTNVLSTLIKGQIQVLAEGIYVYFLGRDCIWLKDENVLLLFFPVDFLFQVLKHGWVVNENGEKNWRKPEIYVKILSVQIKTWLQQKASFTYIHTYLCCVLFASTRFSFLQRSSNAIFEGMAIPTVIVNVVVFGRELLAYWIRNHPVGLSCSSLC